MLKCRLLFVFVMLLNSLALAEKMPACEHVLASSIKSVMFSKAAICYFNSIGLDLKDARQVIENSRFTPVPENSGSGRFWMIVPYRGDQFFKIAFSYIPRKLTVNVHYAGESDDRAIKAFFSNSPLINAPGPIQVSHEVFRAIRSSGQLADSTWRALAKLSAYEGQMIRSHHQTPIFRTVIPLNQSLSLGVYYSSTPRLKRISRLDFIDSVISI